MDTPVIAIWRRTSTACLLLFLASGFAGLVYQSVWSHYLGLTLGHAAYAQSLVLAIFMGGMAGGAWLAGRWSLRAHRLLLAYAILEAMIGVCGLAFHPVFVAYMGMSADTVLPALTHPAAAHAYQWTTAALLIAPQCVLLGATFPILSAGLLRIAPEETAPTLGGLYFSNSLGAAVGALASAFWLLPALGMPGSMLAAGLLNLVVAGAASVLSLRAGVPSAKSPTLVQPRPSPLSPVARWVLLAAAITGATSFVYELGWVRLLDQALGTTIHSFELMLAAFVLGIAFGGLWVRRRRGRGIVLRTAGHAQVLMGIAALVSVPVFNQSFRWVGWMIRHLPRDDAGYAWFSAGSGLIAMIVMFPAAFFAGMTLPLFTVALLQRGDGEASIGRVYAANTFGAILGVFAMMHWLIPGIGVRLAITLAAVADVGLGLCLLRWTETPASRGRYAFAALASLVVCAASLSFGKIDPHAAAGGVFRTGQSHLDERLLVPYLRDGKTATVSVIALPSGNGASISTNGKPDASLATRLALPPQPDESTMLMAGALPLVLHSHPRRIAVIGWGSGLTTQTLLGSSVPDVVESVEIERAMYDGARLFGARVSRAYADPRSHVVFDDARTYFSTGNKRYDVIMSEPSNPWVSGVASLFTQQFYGFASRHLADHGLLVQWVQSYELNDALLATMVAAFLHSFPDGEVYLTNENDLLLVGSKGGRRTPVWSRLDEPPLASELRRVGLVGAEDVALRRLGGPGTLRNLVRLTGATPYSDYYPTVALEGARARFKRERADLLQRIAFAGVPLQELLGERRAPPADAPVTVSKDSTASNMREMGLAVRAALATGRVTPAQRQQWPGAMREVDALLRLSSQPLDVERAAGWSQALVQVAASLHAGLPTGDLRAVFERPAWLLPDNAARPDVQALLGLEAAIASRNFPAMARDAQAMLARPPATMPPIVREQALIAAMLAAIAGGHPGEVSRLEDRYGPATPTTVEFADVRSWLLAWADGAASRQPGAH